MIKTTKGGRDVSTVINVLALSILLLGVVLRVVMLLYNRCMWIDEASVARNVYERNLLSLLHPLNYYQYAPPVFLWIAKLSGALFGYSEYALRAYSLVSGIGSLYILYRILRKETGLATSLYPLFLMATGFLFIRYATEIKQYVPDVLVSVILLWLALRTGVSRLNKMHFVWIWIAAGSLAIWASMPSVFVLAGIGLYYGITFFRQKEWRYIQVLVLIATVWLLQFAAYYLLILKPQINSDYLQGYHNRFFLFATPASIAEWTHNKDILTGIIKAAGGNTTFAVIFNLLLFLTGSIYLLKNNVAKAALFLFPLLLLLLAAALNQYSLIVRLTLFAMPMLYAVMAFGLLQLLKVKFAAWRIALCGMAGFCAFDHQAIATLYQPFEQEEITRGLSFLKERKVESKDIYIATGAEHAYLYYTQMHPAKQQWASVKGAHLLDANINFDSLGKYIQGHPAFLYTIVFDSFDGKRKLDNNLQCVDSFKTEGCYVFMYRKQ